jgi:hypothetical protein
MRLNQFKIKSKLLFLFLRGKLGKLPKTIELPRNSENRDTILLCFPFDEPSFRVASYSFRRLGETRDLNANYILLIREEFKNMISFRHGEIIMLQTDKNEITEDSIDKYRDKISKYNISIVIDLNPEFSFNMSKLINEIPSKLKVGFKSRFSDKFYNLQLDVSKTGFLERGYHSINQMIT